jgi:5-methylcytosine-specific restriction endonuclease McrA
MGEVYQALLFGSEDDARAEEQNRRRLFEEARAREEFRRKSWRDGDPLPEDKFRYAMVDAALDRYPLPMLPFEELDVFGENWTWAWDWAHPRQSESRRTRRNRWNQGYADSRPYVLAYEAAKRADSLGCRVGPRRRVLRVYERASQEQPLPCHWCLRLTERHERHVDHKVPLSRGGEHTASNLCIACWNCNVAKGDLFPEEFKPTVARLRMMHRQILKNLGSVSEKSSGFWDKFFQK